MRCVAYETRRDVARVTYLLITYLRADSLCCEVHGGYAAVDARLREVARKAFLEHYSYRPQHAWIRQLYA